MTNDQNRNQSQQGSGQQGGKDQDNQYSRPGQGGQQGGQQDKTQK